MNEKIGQSELIDLSAIVKGCSQKWFNTTLSRVNDSLVRLGIFEGEFHWHHHDREDELFFVIDGQLHLDLKDQTIEILKNQAYTVPRGVEHRTRAQKKTVVLMVEGDSVNPAGDP